MVLSICILYCDGDGGKLTEILRGLYVKWERNCSLKLRVPFIFLRLSDLKHSIGSDDALTIF